jgi:hypothetical protein
MSEKLVQELVESINRLAATDPQGPAVGERVNAVFTKVGQVKSATAEREVAPAKSETVVDNPTVVEQIDKMRSAAAVPAANYGRVVSILDGLRHAALLASRPQNAAVRPQIVSIVKKMAGVFKEIDTVQDLDKPLEQIESAVHGLYGNQSDNSCYYFDRRGKGHHGEAE